ncbi:MAG TPA: hypothetical protein VJH24_01850 [Candidatus Bilamarchaeaceae archaeon]|nr:hypothetical protein [Candidatus Bilamarchaeaceae archaeon]
MELNELETKIQELETQKNILIDQIKQLNRRLRYKRYEQKALEPFIEQTKDIRIGPIRKQKNAVEFRIATQAYTPRMEREWLKQVKKLEVQLKEVSEIEWARRKLKLVQGDIVECEKQISGVEPELQKIRGELNKLYDNVRAIRAAAKRITRDSVEDDMVTLADIGIIEQQTK